ncbi:hypothetical protein ACWDUL_21800 [Nocardia niigatensis]|uniref:hypothetical protein n=1 Tax=Nocardia niigatensis TaxID=209249 RepID=UPI0002F80037|nr:hypothetical protein [Nocardia niigatensis]
MVDDRYYIDGGVWSPTNADLASDAEVLLVIELLAHQAPREQLQAELAKTTADIVLHFGPDAAMIEVFAAFAADPDPLASWPSAFQAGVRQAPDLAEQLADSPWLSTGR